MTIFMKVDGIDGVGTAKGHEKWIPCKTFQYAVGRSISASVGATADREASKPVISEVTVTTDMDESSPMMFVEACVGKAKKILIDLCTTGSDEIDAYCQYELEDCMVTGYSVVSDGERPSEHITLSFTKITMKYIPHDKAGKPLSPIPAGYDAVTGTKV